MKRFLLFVLAASMFAACTESVIIEQSGVKPIDEAPETLVVGFEEDDKTRIQLNEVQKTVWTNGDLVSVFYRSDANQKWQYTGDTGERVAELTQVDEGVATETMKRVVVVYPYNDNYYINTDTYNVQATLPATQTYLESSYGLDGNIMISQSEYNNISLKSVCGWLKLQLTGNGEKIKSIKLRGNNGEQVAGELYINSADATAILSSDTGSTDDGDTGGAGGGLIFEDTIIKEVVLDCGEGVELGAEATAFYIALPSQTFAKGLTVEISTTDGATMTKSTDNSIVIERNHIQPMTTFVYDGVRPQPNNEIWYTATAKVEPYDKTVFGATYVSNVWDSETGKGVITFEGDVTKIGEYAFYGYETDCNKLTSVTIPESVTTIGEGAFRYCKSLTSVTIPDSVTTIGDYAFNQCNNLKEFKGKFAADGGRCLIVDGVLNAFALGCGATQYTIPDSVTSIGGSALYDCDSLTSITIPDSVTSIGNYAFYSCDSLTEFKGKFADGDGRILVVDGELIAFAQAGITEYTIPDSVTSIGSQAFYGCSSLTSVTIPDSVTEIGYMAFQNCYSLTSVTIGDSVTTIGNYAFWGCVSLTSITIPDSVTSIGYGAFNYCNSLTNVYCKATTPPTLGGVVFDNNGSGRKIYVPASDDDSIINAYKSAEGWSKYAEYIVEFETTYDYMPTLPTDPDPKNLAFNHRAVVIDHTGVNCGYCPGMTDKLLALAKTEWHQHYNEVTCHAGGFASGDPANSAAANALNQMQSPDGYPNININFYTATVSNYAQSTFLNYMGQALEAYIKKDGADVGIAMAVEGDSTNIYCAAQVKAKESKEYKVVAWLLENNIYSPNQAGATKDYHKIYNFALRNISGEYSRNNVSGESIGVLEAGQTHDCAFTLPIVSTKWKWENMGVLVIVSAKDDNNQWEVVNSAYCPVNESKAYEYIE